MGSPNRINIAIRIAPQAKNDSGPDRSHENTNIAAVLSAGGLVAAISYGLGWLAVTRLLTPFNVSPEEIGITSAWVLFRVPFLMIPIIGFAFLLWATIMANRHLGPVIGRAVQLIAVTLIATLVIANYLAPPFRPVHDLLLVIVYISLIGSMLAGASWWLHRRAPSLALSIVFALLFIATGVGWIWNTSAEIASSIENGSYGSLTVLGNVPVISFDQVSVLQLSGDGSLIDIPPRCAILLGSANGTTVVVSSEGEGATVWRLPTDQIALAEGC
jgi:hypothetical protein